MAGRTSITAADAALGIAPFDLDDPLLAEARAAGAVRVRVYRPPGTMVVLGRGSRARLEVDLAACRADGVPVRRRRGGGCAVVLDPGNVIVSVAAPVAGIGGSRAHLDALTRWLARGLAAAGVHGVAPAGISDLALAPAGTAAPRKISGSCVHRARDLLYYSAALLVEADLTRLDRYLRHPPREPGYRAGRRHADFVATLGPRAPGGAAALARRLRTALGPPPLDPRHDAVRPPP